MIKWTWGKPLISDFTNEPQEGFIEVQPDAGIPFKRVKYTDIMDLANVSFILTKDEYVNFMSWYKHTIQQGSIPFDIFDCRYGIERTARILEKPTYTTNSKYYQLNVKIGFNSSVLYQNGALIVNDSDYLIVNDNDRLVAGKTLRL